MEEPLDNKQPFGNRRSRQVREFLLHVLLVLRGFNKQLTAAVLWVLEEFPSWVRWMIMDAVLALCINVTIHRARHLRPLFLAIGWL